jgi:hypothetical protein
MSEGNLGPSKRFVPSGVDAQSWIGFEHRIQERRFKALIETINAAVARRDGVAARVALEEARELRPGTPELEALAARVALLPIAAPGSGSSAYAWYRGLSAVAMFAVGVGLVIGIESMRSGDDITAAKPVALALSPAPAIAAPIGNAITTAPAPIDTTPATDAGTVAAIDVRTPAESLDPPQITVNPKREEPVGTAGVSRVANIGAATAAAPNRTTFRAPDAAPVEPILPASREIPDDNAAQSTRRENRPAITETATSTPAFAANVMPQPVSITAPPPVLPATAAGVSPSIAPRSDNSRVTQVLKQYARAYGQLDPSAAHAVWPSVDERALARAFASLESQDVSFDKCDIDVRGSLASASCSGTASYVGKVGSRQARTEPRQWNFELKLHGDDWKIEKAQTLTR